MSVIYDGYRRYIRILLLLPLISVDLTPPVIYNCPRDITTNVEMGSWSDPVYWMEPWAIDDSGVTTLLTNSHSPGHRFPTGSTLVTYMFINRMNNVAACTFTVHGIPGKGKIG